jgi:uncharacterized damage-inducible protein DinB
MSERARQQFLETFDRELATTMRVLRAYPEDKLDLKPSEKSNSARDVAWIFVLECGLGMRVWNDDFAQGRVSGKPPQAPPTMAEIISALEKSTTEYRALVAGASVEDLEKEVHFFVAPKTMGAMTRMNFLWFLLHDQIHHRGQLSVYLRMAGGKLPSIYGPTADEPWI